MIAVAVACFVRSKRNEQDSLVNFSEEDSAVNKKGLIEEENKEGEGGTGAINESITEDREEDLDHDEEVVE